MQHSVIGLSQQSPVGEQLSVLILRRRTHCRSTVLARLLDSFTDIRSSRVCTCGLWIIGEYSTGQPDIEAALKVGRRGRPVLD